MDPPHIKFLSTTLPIHVKKILKAARTVQSKSQGFSFYLTTTTVSAPILHTWRMGRRRYLQPDAGDVSVTSSDCRSMRDNDDCNPLDQRDCRRRYGVYIVPTGEWSGQKTQFVGFDCVKNATQDTLLKKRNESATRLLT